MTTFQDFKIKKQLLNAITELGFEKPTPIQEASYSTILSGRDFVGIAQTGTGKTIAFLLPILQDLKYSEQPYPRVLILAPTRELVIQIVNEIERLTPYISIRVLGVYGGTNINTQKKAVNQGLDIIVGTPQRLHDLAMTNVLRLNQVKKLVIDEVDIMLDFGYRTQLKNLFTHISKKRQNILFSATMTSYVDELIDTFLVNPAKETISVSGTPLENIQQTSYAVPNFYTKVNLLNHLLQDRETFKKVLIFVGNKTNANRLNELLEFEGELSIIHSSISQNKRTEAIEDFENGNSRILIATDVISRGIDINEISTVISFNTPLYAENYIHRIGRTGRAEKEGNSILLYTEKETELKEAIETLMSYTIPLLEFPKEVKFNPQLTPEERPKTENLQDDVIDNSKGIEVGQAFHEKSDKNKKENAKVKSYYRKLNAKYKKPKTIRSKNKKRR